MIKFIYLFSMFALIACNISDDDKAESLIAEYLKVHANDPKSVEIVNIEKVEPDSASSYEGTAHYGYFSEENKELKEKVEEAKRTHDICLELYEEELQENEKEMEKARLDFKPFFYKRTTVTYSAKNGFGALVLNSAKVRFDKEMSTILKFEDLETE